LGLTRLNALLRLSLTSVTAAFVVVVVGYAAYLIVPRVKSVGRHRRTPGQSRKALSVPEIAVVFGVAAVVAALALGALGRAAAKEFKSDESMSVNPIAFDL
jgi:hypothetical protein